ncbi:MAG: glycine cleavage T C-terminal barrel domain-containing protein [Gammaproteobacteria bacterium]|nr:glycine cleavage T C-terminal barrel domain-containing protein [Gammaproteobacteria bacterium]MDX2461209.1 glycine cleavage T C-terminal barrel domain-containing protein [Gammaproteobacteria bacterium]
MGNSLAFAYIPPRFAVAGTALEVVIPGQPRPARILGEAVYDLGNEWPRSERQEGSIILGSSRGQIP